MNCDVFIIVFPNFMMNRQAELLERKRLKKIRQKEQKTKGRSYKEATKLTGAADILKSVPYAESSPEGDLHALEDHNSSLCESGHFSNSEVNGHTDIEGRYNSELLDIGRAQNVESPRSQGNNNCHIVDSKSQVLELMSEENALHPGHNTDVVKPDPMQKHASSRDLRVAPFNSSEIGTRKGTVENGRECVTALLHEGEISQTNHISCELMIGSICVSLRNCTTQKKCDDSQSESLQESCSIEHFTCGNIGAQDKSTTSNTSLSDDRCWRPVNGRELESFVVEGGVAGVGTTPGKCSIVSSEVDNDSKQNDFIQPEKLALSSHSSRAFLAQSMHPHLFSM